jgi:hypothetical protein
MKKIIGMIAMLTSLAAQAESYTIDKTNLDSVDYTVTKVGIPKFCGDVEYEHNLTINLKSGSTLIQKEDQLACYTFDWQAPLLFAKIKEGFIGSDKTGKFEYVALVVTDDSGYINSGSITKKYFNPHATP